MSAYKRVIPKSYADRIDADPSANMIEESTESVISRRISGEVSLQNNRPCGGSRYAGSTLLRSPRATAYNS